MRVTARISRFQFQMVLDYLDKATAAMVREHPNATHETDAMWRVRIARETLVNAVATDVSIHMKEAA